MLSTPGSPVAEGASCGLPRDGRLAGCVMPRPRATARRRGRGPKSSSVRGCSGAAASCPGACRMPRAGASILRGPRSCVLVSFAAEQADEHRPALRGDPASPGRSLLCHRRPASHRPGCPGQAVQACLDPHGDGPVMSRRDIPARSPPTMASSDPRTGAGRAGPACRGLSGRPWLPEPPARWRAGCRGRARATSCGCSRCPGSPARRGRRRCGPRPATAR